MAEDAAALIPVTRLRRGRPDTARRWGPTISERAMIAEYAQSARARGDAARVLRLFPRPETRGDCAPAVPGRAPGKRRLWGPGEPCPWVGCRHHLAIAINPVTGGMKELEGWDEDGQPVCVLDLADAGGVTLDRAGHLEGITRERVRQIEVRALMKLRGRQDEGLMLREIPADDELSP